MLQNIWWQTTYLINNSVIWMKIAYNLIMTNSINFTWYANLVILLTQSVSHHESLPSQGKHWHLLCSLWWNNMKGISTLLIQCVEVLSARGHVYWQWLTLIAYISSWSFAFQILKLGNAQIIFHTLNGMWLFIHAGVHVNNKGLRWLCHSVYNVGISHCLVE